MNLGTLSKDLQNLLLSAYIVGYWDRDAKLTLFNSFKTKEEQLSYLEIIINPTPNSIKVNECIEFISECS